ncbi:MAG: rod shape-determining protein RodA [Spirochaetia bacterium]|nr:rod shape-determining protein RodA [Spirochaetia bacterium]
MNSRKSFLTFDFIIILAILCLSVISVCFIYSSGLNSDGVNTSFEFIKQIIWIVTGLGLMTLVIVFDYKYFYDFAYYIYGICIFMLIITLLVGNKVNGARSWLGLPGVGIQPSEFTKLGTIIALSAFCAKNRNNIRSIVVFLRAALIPALPMVLILAQPDLGTSLVYIPIFLVILFMAGTKIRYLFFLVACGIGVILFTIIPMWSGYVLKQETFVVTIFSNQLLMLAILGACLLVVILSAIGWFAFKKGIYYWICYSFVIISVSLFVAMLAQKILKDYQIMRLVVFLDPDVDPQGAGWNILQSLTAIGSGGLFGKGFLKGTQSHYHYLPQQSNDFIFSIIAEEIGFFGSMVVFLCFFIILIRGFIIAYSSKDSFGSYICFGIIAMFFFHFMVNIGMAMGIMPITGIPLLFLSYGGSSLWTSMMAAGILINIYYRRYGFKI